MVPLENEFLTAHLFPEVGARIYNLTYQPKDCLLWWHHPRVELRSVPLEASYDDNFSGG
jgi:hypothetical protein